MDAIPEVTIQSIFNRILTMLRYKRPIFKSQIYYQVCQVNLGKSVYLNLPQFSHWPDEDNTICLK